MEGERERERGRGKEGGERSKSEGERGGREREREREREGEREFACHKVRRQLDFLSRNQKKKKTSIEKNFFELFRRSF